MDKTPLTPYDEVPYPSYAYAQTHPDNLATLATLSGMTPPPITECRVLELGCASGGNLIPMAYSLPGSQFVGIDLSGTAIARGQATVSELGLKNITLQHLDILDIADDFGQFDYIIVYGIYSWVPTEVRDKILSICRQHLAPNGVAYVSYNVYPGWRMNNIIRDMMLYHTGQMDESETQITQGRAVLEYMAQKAPAENSVYKQYLKNMHEFLTPKSDSYLFHDFMAMVNRPLYFHQFIERAEAHNLQYLANAEFSVAGTTVPPETTQELFDLTQDNITQVEQYLDFLTNRMFRQTLLCHQEIPISRALKPEYLAGLYLASNIQPESPELDIQSEQLEVFESSDEKTLSTAHPPTKAALLHLARQWPDSVSFSNLLEAVESLLNIKLPPDSHDARILAVNLLTAYSQSLHLVDLHSYVPSFVPDVSDRPEASMVARYEAKNNKPVTNLYHRLVTMDDLSQILLEYLDGTRNRAVLLDVLQDLHSQGVVNVEKDDQPVNDESLIKSSLAEELEYQLQGLANVALLVG